MIAKTVVLLTIYFGSYAIIVLDVVPLPWMLPICFVMGIAMAGIGFSISHDALHGAYAADRRVNKLLGFTFDALGANGYMWRVTHNRIHHLYTNIRGYDEDIEVSPQIRLSPHTPHRPIHKYQHIFAFFAYSLSTIFWIFVKDYKYFLKRDLGPYRNKTHPRSEWAFLILSKLAYYALMIALPLLVIDDITWWSFLLGFLALHLTAGLILGVIFQLAHVVEPTAHFPPGDAPAIRGAWMVHQMRTTSDFARGNRWLSWYLGGINFQVEHHLFPKICHIHYDKMSPIIEEVAARHGVPHNAYPTLWQAIRSHYRTLKRFGDPAFVATRA